MRTDVARDALWIGRDGPGPVLAVALHAGHAVRDEIHDRLALDPVTRRREEDPFTDYLARAAGPYLIATRSRFEVDLNRARHEAVYRGPEDAWGLDVWREPLPDDVVRRSLHEWDAFYTEYERRLDRMLGRYRHVAVLDLHTYNHRRDGPDAPVADAWGNPDVNVGTGSLARRDLFGPVVARFMEDLGDFPYPGGPLDVRENVRFRGRHLAAFTHARWPDRACVLAIEVKKIFMDEWSGVPDVRLLTAVRDALRSTLPGLVEELSAL